MTYYRRYSSRPTYQKNTPSIDSNPIAEYTEQELTDPTIDQRIRNTLSRNQLTDWEKDFLQSIFVFFASKKRLSNNQYGHLQKIENKYSDAVLAAAKEFTDSLSDQDHKDIRIVASVYRNNKSPYHMRLINNILDVPNFVPTKEEWNKLMNNKYAIGYLGNVKSKPKYQVGDAVMPSSLGKHHRDKWSYALVIDNVDILPTSYAEGGKRYSVLPYGHTKPVVVEEREIKKSDL